jgi:hypothetical protein
LTILSEHVTQSGIVSMAFQQQKHAILWCVLGDGTVAAMTYEKEHEVVGWARHDFGGTVLRVDVLPQDDTDDQVWFIVERTINGSTVRYIECLDNINYNLTALSDAYFVDCGVTTSITAAKTITGLDHLEGKLVAVLADGVVLSDGYTANANFTVTSGTITLSATNVTYATVHIGLPYKTTITPSRIEMAEGTRSRTKRIVRATLMLYNTAGAKYGADASNLYSAEITQTALYTGYVDVNTMNEYNKEALLVIQQDKPLPLTLNGIEYEVQIND